MRRLRWTSIIAPLSVLAHIALRIVLRRRGVSGSSEPSIRRAHAAGADEESSHLTEGTGFVTRVTPSKVQPAAGSGSKGLDDTTVHHHVDDTDAENLGFHGAWRSRLPGRRGMIVAALLVIAALIAVGVSTLGDDARQPSEQKTEILGARLSADELADMTMDSMGTAKLKDVAESGPSNSSESQLGTVSDGVRSFTLEARPVRWEYRDGQRVAAWAYNGQVPGPVLRANEGENVRIEFRNELPVATTVHWHGIDLPWRQDGVPGVTQKAIEPGEAFTYEFKATPSGTRWYHTHGTGTDDEASQLDMGLSGAFIVRPKREVAADVDRVIVLDEWSIGADGYNAAMLGPHAAHVAGASFNVFTLNGRAAPDTEEIVVKKGDRVRLRFVNASTVSYHPMHIHGHQARVVALDGNPTASPTVRNVELLAPGQTADIEFIANNPGVWMMHCHDLHHATSGMSLLVRYEGFEPISNEHGGGSDDSDDSDRDDGDRVDGSESKA